MWDRIKDGSLVMFEGFMIAMMGFGIPVIVLLILFGLIMTNS